MENKNTNIEYDYSQSPKFEVNKMENKNTKLPDELVKIVIASCPKCEGGIRFGVEHKMDKKDFYKEVVKYNLTVKTIPLLEYQKNKPSWCECD